MTDAAPPTAPPVIEHAPEPRTSGLAIASLVLGLISLTGLLVGCTAVFALVGLPLGIAGLVKIGGSNGALRGSGLAVTGIVTSCIGLLAAVVALVLVIPAFTHASDSARLVKYQTQVQQLGMCLELAAIENNGRLPDAATWGDDLITANLVSDAGDLAMLRGSPFGDTQLAFNAALSGVRIEDLESPELTVLLFETDIDRGIDVGGPDDLAMPDRDVLIGLADGTAVRCDRDDALAAYLWTPTYAAPTDDP